MREEHQGKHCPEEHQSKHSPDDIAQLLRTLIEVQLTVNELLASLGRKVDTAICVLEHISRNTCETVNEIDRLAQCKALAGCRESCKFLSEPQHDCCDERPAPRQSLAQHAKHVSPCTYEPCKPAEESGGSAVSVAGSAPPQRTFGAPYPPAVRTAAPDDDANESTAPKTPRGPFRGFLVPGEAHRLLDFQSGGGAAGDDPVVFSKYTNSGTVAAPASTVAADISGAESGSIVLATGNQYILYSIDGGSTFTTLDPTTVFDNTADGGFCCDQIVQYAPSIDRFIWLMQFQKGRDGKNRLRIATASPETVQSSTCTSWTYWDLTSDALGIVTTAADAALNNHWLDYPNMSLGTNYLYVSIDNVRNGSATGGRIIVRIPLSDIAAGGTINYQYTNHAYPVDST
jgi:hypothetical protein